MMILRKGTSRILFEHRNSDSEGSKGVYKLYEGMRNVQVMRKDVKNPDEGGEPICNLEISLSLNVK